jgi:hypothetical protein
MLRLMLAVLVFVSVGLAQSSSDGSFSVRHAKNAKFSLSPAQMLEAERLYRNAVAVVQRDVHSSVDEPHLHFTVIVGKDRNMVHTVLVHEVRSDSEIWMKKWDPTVFAEGVVVLAVDDLLTVDMIKQLSKRAILLSNPADDDVAGVK